ncbi:unnamed protein product [Orchesella dallaii]|uniref:Uncharacterized protein n=1 Tax=Orchesella dallaii TaxID=48710 RepID=A0ABP1QME3_9HEXA
MLLLPLPNTKPYTVQEKGCTENEDWRNLPTYNLRRKQIEKVTCDLIFFKCFFRRNYHLKTLVIMTMDLLNKLKSLILIPLIVLSVILALRACLEMVLVLKMTDNGNAIVIKPVYDRDTYSISTSSSSPPHPPTGSSSASQLARERNQFGWISGGGSPSNFNQYLTPSLNSHRSIDSSSSSSFSSGTGRHSSNHNAAANNADVETSFVTNVMVVSLL